MVKMADEFIDPNEVQVSPRGRSKVLDQELLDTLAQVTKDRAVRLSKTFGPTDKNDRNKVSTTIRKHWKEIREDTPKIDFSNEGIPQVTVRG